MPAIAVTFTPAQINQIASYFALKQFVQSNSVALAGTDQLATAISGVSTSISIGAGSVSCSINFSPPLNNLSNAQQAALICYIVQMAMGVPLT